MNLASGTDDPTSAESEDALYFPPGPSASGSERTEDAFPPGPTVSGSEPTEDAYPPGPSVSASEPTDSGDADDGASDDLDVDEDEVAEVTGAGEGSDIQPCI
jgi:hypothetical protein